MEFKNMILKRKENLEDYDNFEDFVRDVFSDLKKDAPEKINEIESLEANALEKFNIDKVPKHLDF